MITKIAVATTATLVDAASERQWLMIQNQSDTAIFLSFDGTATVTTDSGATPGIRLAPYDTIMSTDIPAVLPETTSQSTPFTAGPAPKTSSFKKSKIYCHELEH